MLAEYNGEIVGTQAAIPYFLITGSGEKILSAKSEDTLVSPSHRGKQIFEKMYAVLFEACKNQNIALIWGFTYADKPFKKLGFEIPYKACMGILVKDLQPAAQYFVSLASKRSTKEHIGIYALALFSKCKAMVQLGFRGTALPLVSGPVELSGAGTNYLHSDSNFGLVLDAAFLDYRIQNNPYKAIYNTLSYYQDNQLKISMTYSVSENKVCYIIHLYLSPDTRSGLLKQFMLSILRVKEIQGSKVIRFWGFRHNSQNQKEVEMLSDCGFTFINKGISLVWKNLDKSLHLNPSSFVLSRMASQGTD